MHIQNTYAEKITNVTTTN